MTLHTRLAGRPVIISRQLTGIAPRSFVWAASYGDTPDRVYRVASGTADGLGALLTTLPTARMDGQLDGVTA